jgi:hypothetical protein
MYLPMFDVGYITLFKATGAAWMASFQTR